MMKASGQLHCVVAPSRFDGPLRGADVVGLKRKGGSRNNQIDRVDRHSQL